MTKQDREQIFKILKDSGNEELALLASFAFDSLYEYQFNVYREEWLKNHYLKLYTEAMYYAANEHATKEMEKYFNDE